jgi:hypothetical protein
MPKKIDAEKYEKLFEDCQSTCKGKYCFYKHYLLSQHPAIYVVVQIKMIEKMKWIWVSKGEIQLTEEEAKDDKLVWDKASMKWIETGLAKAYRIAFDKLMEGEEDKPIDFEDIEIVFTTTIEIHKKMLDNQPV